MKLSKRLLSLAKYVEYEDHVADIGCDHALLDIYLINNNIVPHILISDVNENALNAGISNIKRFNLTDRIDTSLAFGLEKITSDIDTLIISGMGASTICKILDDSRLLQIHKLIIQSNNDHFTIRKFLTTRNFYISEEEFIEDNNKPYINIIFMKGNASYSMRELKYGPIFINSHNNNYFDYLIRVKNNILNKIPKSKVIVRFKIKKELKLLNKLKKK